MLELYKGGGGPGACSKENFLKIGLSETPYPAFPGSNAINSYVHFVELFSESRCSWFPSRSTKIHVSQVFKTNLRSMILTFFVTMIHDSASTPLTRYYEKIKSSWWSKRGNQTSHLRNARFTYWPLCHNASITWLKSHEIKNINKEDGGQSAINNTSLPPAYLYSGRIHSKSQAYRRGFCSTRSVLPNYNNWNVGHGKCNF